MRARVASVSRTCSVQQICHKSNVIASTCTGVVLSTHGVYCASVSWRTFDNEKHDCHVTIIHHNSSQKWEGKSNLFVAFYFITDQWLAMFYLMSFTIGKNTVLEKHLGFWRKQSNSCVIERRSILTMWNGLGLESVWKAIFQDKITNGNSKVLEESIRCVKYQLNAYIIIIKSRKLHLTMFTLNKMAV